MPRKTKEVPVSSLSLSEALARQSKDLKYPEWKTHIAGVTLRMEDDIVPKDISLVRYLGKSAIRNVLNSGRRIFRSSRHLSRLESEQTQRTDTYKNWAKDTGFRGLISKSDGFSIGVFPKYDFKDWDKAALRRVLGPSYDHLVSEQLQAIITLPKGQETADSPVTAESLRAQLISMVATGLNCSEIEAESMVRFDQSLVVDTKALGAMIVNKQVVLPDEVASVTETWSLTTREIK